MAFIVSPNIAITINSNYIVSLHNYLQSYLLLGRSHYQTTLLDVILPHKQTYKKTTNNLLL